MATVVEIRFSDYCNKFNLLSQKTSIQMNTSIQKARGEQSGYGRLPTKLLHRSGRLIQLCFVEFLEYSVERIAYKHR